MSRGLLPYKGLMGTCGQPGYVFRDDFCLKQGIEFFQFLCHLFLDAKQPARMFYEQMMCNILVF